MPDSCCAVGCSNRRGKDENIKFFRIPSGTRFPQRRKAWLTAIKRECWSEEKIAGAKLCSDHFISGNYSLDRSNPDYVPSIFKFKRKDKEASQHKLARFDRLQNRRSNVSSTETASCSTTSPSPHSPSAASFFDFDILPSISADDGDNKGTQMQDVARKILKKKILNKNVTITKLLNVIKKLKKDITQKDEVINVLKQNKFCYHHIKDDTEKMKFFTGLINKNYFEWIYSLIKDKVKTVNNLKPRDHLLIVLIKLKLGLYNKDIAYRFCIKPVVVSRIYRRWLPVLAKELQHLIIWPEKEALRKSLPTCFKKFKKCVSIIDCTEIFVERPLKLNARAQTWSNYKNHNTIKYLISITPAGAVSFLSKGWGGRVSDKEITNKSGYLDKIEHGDVILADRGFTIETELAAKGATLHIPAFTKGKSQLPTSDVDNSRKIANVRIHVERVIGRSRKFDIFNRTIPISQVDLLDNVVVCVCALVNLNPSVVSQ